MPGVCGNTAGKKSLRSCILAQFLRYLVKSANLMRGFTVRGDKGDPLDDDVTKDIQWVIMRCKRMQRLPN